ncbi:MAG: hypothetical protein H6740_07560 [Alphaproteobacteria bacterium]|nr:hypothetical protein [Alphaproteobacteria bacterium]
MPVDPAALNQLVAQISPIGVIPSGGALYSGDWNLLVRAVVAIAEQLGADPVAWADVARSSRTVEDVASGEESSSGASTPSTSTGGDSTLRAEFERLRSSVSTRTEATRLAIEAQSARIAALEDGGGASTGSGDSATAAAVEALTAQVQALTDAQVSANARVEALTARVQQLGDRMGSLERTNAAQDETLSTLTQRVARLESVLSGLSSGGSSVDEAVIAELRDAVTRLGSGLSALRTQVTDLGTAGEALEARVAAIERRLGIELPRIDADILAARDYLDGRLRPMDAFADRLSSAEDALGTFDSDVNARFDEMTRAAAEAGDELGGLRNRLSTAERGLTDVQTWRTRAADELGSLGRAVDYAESNLTSRISAVEGDVARSVNGLQSSVSGITDRLGAAERGVTDLGSSVGGLSTSVSNVNRTVSGLSSTVSGLSTTVSDMGRSVTTLNQDYSRLNSTVTSVSGSVRDLTNTVSNLDRTLVDMASTTRSTTTDYSAALNSYVTTRSP